MKRQMEIRQLSIKNKEWISEIWKECFTQDEEYIDTFISCCIPFSHTFGIIDSLQNKAVSILTLLPSYLVIKKADGLKRLKGFYIYGVGTLLKERGKGYASMLLNYATEFAQGRGNHYLALKPAELSLFDLYRNHGFSTPLLSKVVSIDLSKERLAVVKDEELYIDEYFITREEQLRESHLLWEKEILNYSVIELKSRGGICFSIIASGSKLFCSLYPISDTRIRILDHNIISDEQLSKLLGTIKRLFPKMEKVNIEFPRNTYDSIDFLKERDESENSLMRILPEGEQYRSILESYMIALAME